MTRTYIERDCTIEHEGRKFSAGGAAVTPDRIVAYVGRVLPNSPTHHALTDWHGQVIGSCRLMSTWRTPRSYVSPTMSQIYATVDGVVYTGRGSGEGMVFTGRRVR